MLQNYNASNGQSNYDVCCNTYGTLDLLVKLLIDSGVDNVDQTPVTGQQFVYDDQLIVDQGANQNYFQTPVRYATDINIRA